MRWMASTGLQTLCLALGFFVFVTILAPPAAGQHSKKKDEEPKTQVLPLPKEPPAALVADATMLSFRVTPLLRTGMLSTQIRDALNEVVRDAHGASIVRVRAFVAGAGDSRRVQALVSEIFADRKVNLPVVSIIQVGALGDDAAQVVIESILSDHRDENPGGLVFLAGQHAASLEASLSQIDRSLTQVSLSPASVASVTCLLHSLVDYGARLSAATARFPNASINLVQSLRERGTDAATCEAIARIAGSQPAPATAMASARATLIPRRVVFTGLQLGFGDYLDDAALALDRLRKNTASVNGIWDSMASLDVYSLSGEASSALRKTASKFSVPDRAITIEPVEGLPSHDASFGVEAIMPASDVLQAVRTEQ
jgi:enamine deaminase RidA (YjgF/YER057c/UK114 family)